MNTTPGALHLPRSPVLGWASFAGARASELPCLLNHRTRQFTTSGRTALFLAPERYGVQACDKLLVPGRHCPSMVAPSVALQATPVVYGLNGLGQAALLQLPTGTARVLMAVHLFGLPQPLAASRACCEASGTALLENCAHALFGRIEGRAIGGWGDMAIGSLTKFLPVADGGSLIENRVDAARLPAPLAPAGAARTAQDLPDVVEQGAQHNRLLGLNLAIRTALHGLRGLRRTWGARSTAVAAPPPNPAGNTNLDADLQFDTGRARTALATPCPRVASRACHARTVQARRQRYRHDGPALSGHEGMKPLPSAVVRLAVAWLGKKAVVNSLRSGATPTF